MALIPPSFLDCVVAIGELHDGRKEWIGTGFLVGRPVDGAEKGNSYYAFLVTNKHVLEGKEKIIIRFNKLIDDGVVEYPVDLIRDGEKMWVGHDASHIDVAAFMVNPNALDIDDAKFSRFLLDKQVMTVSDLSDEGVSEGDGVFVLGFPMSMVSVSRNYVIARKGCIAKIRSVLEKEEDNYLIDAFVFPGNSGGPVVIHPQFTFVENTKPIKNARLIGIVKQYVPYEDVAISTQTNRPRVTFEENSGLAVVETIDSIIETVERCFSEMIGKEAPNVL